MCSQSAGGYPAATTSASPLILSPQAAEHLRKAVQQADRMLRSRDDREARRCLVLLLGHLRALRPERA